MIDKVVIVQIVSMKSKIISPKFAYPEESVFFLYYNGHTVTRTDDTVKTVLTKQNKPLKILTIITKNYPQNHTFAGRNMVLP